MHKMSSTTVTAKPLSLLGKLDLLLGFFGIAIAGFVAVFTGLWRSERDAPTYYLHIAYAVLRKVTERYSPLQLQWALPGTDEVYEQYVRSKGIEPQSVNLMHGAKGHWVGDPNAENVLIWYHGGGFAMAANLAFFEFWDRLIISARANNKDLAIFALSYTLTPHAQYPTQLTQAVEAMRYIASQKKQRKSIVIGGDSAGASLTMGVLSHLAHPHPTIAPLKLAQPLAGAVLLAFPPTMDESRAEGQELYCGGDIVVPSVGTKWLNPYMGTSKKDNYTSPLEAPTNWFKALPVKKILVLAGGNEVLRPFMEEFVEKVTPVFPAIELFIGKREAHVAPVYNLYVGVKEETRQGKKLNEWLKEIL